MFFVSQKIKKLFTFNDDENRLNHVALFNIYIYEADNFNMDELLDELICKNSNRQFLHRQIISKFVIIFF